MGCGISVPTRGQRLPDALSTYSLRSRLAKSLDQCLPAADNAKTPLPTQPAGWGIFADERERNNFIKITLLVLTDNGTLSNDELTVEIFYPRCNKGCAAQIAVMDLENVKHTIVGPKYADTERVAFLILKREIEIQLDVLMRRNHKVVSSSRVANERKVRKIESQQSVRSARHRQPSRRASRQSILPTSSPAAIPEDISDKISRLPTSQRRSLIAQHASPEDLKAMYDVPESTALAAKRRSALYIPPLDSQDWKDTRMPQQRSDSMPTARPTPIADGFRTNKPTGTSTALTTVPPLPMIQHAGRYSSAAACRETNDALEYHNGQYRQQTRMYELSYYGKEDLRSGEGGGGDLYGGGNRAQVERPVGPGVALQREAAAAAAAAKEGAGGGAAGRNGELERVLRFLS